VRKVTQMNILLIEDERPLALAMVRILTRNGYHVRWSSDGLQGFEDAKADPYDLIILDILLPGKSGWDVCGELRAVGVTTPILVVSAMDEMTDKVKGLNLGADDYLAKPFEAPELVARVKALLRREDTHRGPVVRVADLEIDRTSRTVTRAGTAVSLHADEYELLEKLAVNEGTVMSKAVLAHCLESVDPLADEVDERIASLVKKIDEPFGSRLIRPLGDGYILVDAV
jgi:DNA-binding response OmpR family regulator